MGQCHCRHSSVAGVDGRTLHAGEAGRGSTPHCINTAWHPDTHLGSGAAGFLTRVDHRVDDGLVAPQVVHAPVKQPAAHASDRIRGQACIQGLLAPAESCKAQGSPHHTGIAGMDRGAGKGHPRTGTPRPTRNLVGYSWLSGTVHAHPPCTSVLTHALTMTIASGAGCRSGHGQEKDAKFDGDVRHPSFYARSVAVVRAASLTYGRALHVCEGAVE